MARYVAALPMFKRYISRHDWFGKLLRRDCKELLFLHQSTRRRSAAVLRNVALQSLDEDIRWSSFPFKALTKREGPQVR